MKTLIGILVVGVVVVGGYYAFRTEKAVTPNVGQENGGTQNSAETQTEVQTSVAPDGKKIPFADFIAKGGSYKCTVNQSVGGTDTKGTTYINGGMIRGEFSTKVQGFSLTSNLIVRDGYTYSWTSASPTMGYKAKVVEPTTTDVNTPTSGSYSFNAEQIGDYSCEAWSGDASKFALPAGVNFQAIN